MSTQRYRSFNWVMYVESLPDNWLDYLDSLHIPIILGDHDKDVWSELDEEKDPAHKAGTLKKEHIHGVFLFDGKKSLKQVLELLAPLGINYAEPTHNVQSFIRYLLHMDNPEKAQYGKDSIICLGGAVPDFTRTIPQSEVQAIVKQIGEFVRERGITEFCELWFYAMDNEPDWFTVLNNGKAYVVSQVIKSVRHSKSAGSTAVSDGVVVKVQ